MDTSLSPAEAPRLALSFPSEMVYQDLFSVVGYSQVDDPSEEVEPLLNKMNAVQYGDGVKPCATCGAALHKVMSNWGCASSDCADIGPAEGKWSPDHAIDLPVSVWEEFLSRAKSGDAELGGGIAPEGIEWLENALAEVDGK